MASSASSTSTLLQELKTRARLRLNASKRGDDTADEKLKDCLNAVSRDAGFANWDHARVVLGGEAKAGDDMGTFWYCPGCAALLNVWFASYPEAQAARAVDERAFLVPYKRQFILVQDDFVRELALDPEDPAWVSAGRDLVSAYGTDAWAHLAASRLDRHSRGGGNPGRPGFPRTLSLLTRE